MVMKSEEHDKIEGINSGEASFTNPFPSALPLEELTVVVAR